MSERIKDVFLNPLSINVQFENIGVSECLPGHRVGPESRKNYVLHFVKSGKGTFYFENVKYEMSKGNFFILSPDKTIVYEADEDDPWVYQWVSFSGHHMENLFEVINIDLRFPIGKVEKYEEINECFSYLLESTDFLVQNTLAIYANMFRLLSLFEMHEKPIKQDRITRKDTFDYLVNRFFKILDNPDKLGFINVEDVSKELGVSRSYLNRIIKKETNKSARDWIISKKIKRACFLLESSKMNIFEIANSLGYDHSSSFSRAFTTVMGLSPKVYRLEYRKSLENDGFFSKNQSLKEGRETIMT
ncbi:MULTISPECIES: AraC family transcriptional regulator [Enterococcus]|uniref:AraC family transcriptional regulator n=1 Tax=Enterococcus TaxID=1350 RepID=UPI003567844C